MRRSYLVACALGSVCLLATAISLAENPSQKSAGKKNTEREKQSESAKSPVSSTGMEAIEAALQKPIACEFVETPLKDVIDYLKDVAHIEIFLDESALKEAGIDPATAITCNLRGLRLEKVLNLVLEPQKLSWTIHDDVLYVASPAKLESEEFFEARVYDVADLVVYQDQDGKKFDDYTPLIDLLTATLDPKIWVDGNRTMWGETLGTAKVLVVTQSYDAHKKISKLLAKIRAVAAKKSGGDGLPTRTRPKATEKATMGGFRCPGMIPDQGAAKGAVPPSKSAESQK